MPDLEKCTICGSQMLVANYQWSNKRIVCMKCQEHNSEINHKNSDIDCQNRDTSYSKSSSISLQNKTVFSDKYQIFITWPLISRITCYFLFIFVVIIGVAYTLDYIKESDFQQPVEKL
tara:strand:+ start:62 stop:415 length:354 start_codon:yes stop_codon:yes gene_type:complete